MRGRLTLALLLLLAALVAAQLDTDAAAGAADALVGGVAAAADRGAARALTAAEEGDIEEGGAATATGATGAKAAPLYDDDEAAAATEEDKAREADIAAADAEVAAIEAAAAEVEAAAAAGEAGDADVPEVVLQTDAQVEAAMEEAVEAQQEGKRTKVVSKLVSQAAAAAVPGGYGDMPLGGTCKTAIGQYCRKVEPGERRLANCLLRVIRASADGDRAAGVGPRVSASCARDVYQFLEAISANVNANLPIARACAKDIEEYCSNVSPDEEGGVLSCLRAKRPRLRGRCKTLVFELEQDASDDYRADKALLQRCKSDISRLCSKHIKDPQGGEMQQCLMSQEGSLSWECRMELYREEMEQSDDIRLSLGLMLSCMDSKEKFCEGVAPGESNTKDCLELHMYEEGFGEECRERLEELIAHRSKWFRMDSVIREHCVDDITRLCGVSREAAEAVDLLEGPTTVDEEAVSRCLQDRRSELQDPACERRVTLVIAATYRDIRYNHPLADACAHDRETLCAGEPLGSAGVVRCLGRQRERLSDKCAAVLFDTEAAMAEDITFNWPLKMACAAELRNHCDGVIHGRGRVIRCLQDAAEEHPTQFSAPCLEAVKAQEQASASDYRLNPRLSKACKDDMARLCPRACGALERKTGCGSSMLRCLSEWVGNIESEACQAEVAYYQKMQVRHFRNDLALAEACREDVDKLCSDAPEDEILACLHRNRTALTDACRFEETRMDLMQSTSIELRPMIASACLEERQAHCADVRPGHAAVLNCLLMTAANSLDFSSACIDALDQFQERRLKDHRLDFQLRLDCKEDVEQHCAEAAEAAGSVHDVMKGLGGDVFLCLLTAYPQLRRSCATQVSRAALTGLEFYRPGLPGVGECDVDVARMCPHGSSFPALGVVRDCLTTFLDAEREQEAGADAAAAAAAQGQSTDGFPGVDDGSGEQGVAVLDEPQPGGVRRRRALLQEDGVAEGGGEGGEEEGRPEGQVTYTVVNPNNPSNPDVLLLPQCRAFLEIAMPVDVYEHFSDSVTAAGVLSQLESMEAGLGLKPGTLHNPVAEKGHEVLTLTGWVALVGLFALVTVLVALGVFVVRRYTGLGGNSSTRGYTLVVKHETELPTTTGGPSQRGLPRRYG